jgi:hypothetical protein
VTVGGRDIRGRPSVDAEIVDFQRRMPKGLGVLASVIDTHGTVSRFAAIVEGTPDGVALEFLDVCEHRPDGKILRIMTFVGATPPRRSD